MNNTTTDAKRGRMSGPSWRVVAGHGTHSTLGAARRGTDARLHAGLWKVMPIYLGKEGM